MLATALYPKGIIKGEGIGFLKCQMCVEKIYWQLRKRPIRLLLGDKKSTNIYVNMMAAMFFKGPF